MAVTWRGESLELCAQNLFRRLMFEFVESGSSELAPGTKSRLKNDVPFFSGVIFHAVNQASLSFLKPRPAVSRSSMSGMWAAP